MSELFINTTMYYILAIIVYLYIAITSVLLISTAARNFTADLINKLKAKLPKLGSLGTVKEYSAKYFFFFQLAEA